MNKIAIFASGTGSNAVNLAHYFSKNKNIEIALLISNKTDAPVIAKMRDLNIPVKVVTNKEFNDSSLILALLQEYNISFIVLAGFLRIVPTPIIKAYENRIINIHPSLLPKYGGKGMYGMKVHEAVVASGDNKSGITIHFINDHYDEGEIIFQAVCNVLPTDSPEIVAQKVHALEYEYYPKITEKIVLSIKS